jgi:hypothetical protein
MPAGIVSRTVERGCIIRIVPRAALSNPSDVRYSNKTTFRVPFPTPLKTDAARNNFADLEILSGTIDLRYISQSSTHLESLISPDELSG